MRESNDKTSMLPDWLIWFFGAVGGGVIGWLVTNLLDPLKTRIKPHQIVGVSIIALGDYALMLDYGFIWNWFRFGFWYNAPAAAHSLALAWMMFEISFILVAGAYLFAMGVGVGIIFLAPDSSPAKMVRRIFPFIRNVLRKRGIALPTKKPWIGYQAV